MNRKPKHPEDLAPNRSYCDRLAQLVFPTTVRVNDERETNEDSAEPADTTQTYDKDGLREAMAGDEVLLARMARRHFMGTKDISVDAVLDKAFPERVLLLGKLYTFAELSSKLPENPKLQHAAAVHTHFTPSKWLLEQELHARVDWSETDEDIYKVAARKGLLGVCFSGGGIRSATFNLGIVQGLAQLGLLPHLDYLSSVSGGGYIHEFLAAWILRHPSGLSGVIEELIPQAEPGCLPRAPEPIKWLTRYASYLTPARGIFSTDTWTMIAIWFRNTILNQIPIMAALSFVFLLVHLLAPAPEWCAAIPWAFRGVTRLWVEVAALAIAGWSLWQLGLNLHRQRGMRNPRSEAGFRKKHLLGNADVQWRIMVPWLALSLWTICWLRMLESHQAHRVDAIVFALWVLAITMLVIFAGGAMDSFQILHPDARWWKHVFAVAAFCGIGVVASAIACAVGYGIVHAGRPAAVALAGWLSTLGGASSHASPALGCPAHCPALGGNMPIDPWRLELTLLPGLLLSVPYIAIELSIGLLGRNYKDIQREWMARLRAWATLYALVWSGVVGISLLGPYVGYRLVHLGPGFRYTALATFAVSHLTTILTGWSGKSDGKPTEGAFLGLKTMDLLAVIAAPITILGLLLTISSFAAWGVDSLYANLTVLIDAESWKGVSLWPFGVTDLSGSARALAAAPYWMVDAVAALAALGIAALFGWRIDINEFSMQLFYRNRLTRCYIAATTPNRQPDPFTGFDRRSRLSGVPNHRGEALLPAVSDLLPDRFNKQEKKGSYDGPFPIFCATLNLTTGEDLATQERKGTSFAFTPLYSGYSVSWTDGRARKHVSYNGFVPTECYAYPKGGIHLDTAVAISGAAVNPSMGYNSNPILAFLMTFFNVRLGWWITNTRKMNAWRASNGRTTPWLALGYLLKELFGMVNDGSTFVNLSDGGHFENMGLYELVRRRCRFIVVCDAEEDPGSSFGGMGAAITKCRSDFGAEIDLDLRPLRVDEKTGYSQAHCVVGTITYPPPLEDHKDVSDDWGTDCTCMEHQPQDLYTGVIVYLKSSLVGDEPPDLLTYQLAHPSFPQDSTLNQWFTGTQFEAYRRLGHHVAMTAIQPALAPGKIRYESQAESPTGEPLDEIFKRMNAIWYPRTPEMEAHLSEHLKQYESLLKELRERPELAGLEAAMNDPTPGVQPRVWLSAQAQPGVDVFALQFANSLLDFMATVYINLKLAFPDNRVSPHAEWWICLFRRWCRVDIVRASWLSHAETYPIEFQLFARRELRLP